MSGEELTGSKCFCPETYQAITTSELCGLVCSVSSSKSLIVQNHPKYRILPTRVAKSWAKMCESARATPAAPLASVITTRWRAVPTLSKEAASWVRTGKLVFVQLAQCGCSLKAKHLAESDWALGDNWQCWCYTQCKLYIFRVLSPTFDGKRKIICGDWFPGSLA